MDQHDRSEIEDHLRHQIEAYHDAGLAYAAVKLGLPETMGSDAWTAERLATALDVSAPHLFRMLRGLATLGLVETRPDETFALTAAGRSLAPGAHSTLREKLQIVVEQYWQPWAHLASCVQSGTPAFEQVFGAPIGDWRRDHHEHGAVFEAYLEGETFPHAQPIVEALDLSGAETVAEIGGAHGAFLAALLLAHPDVRGILMDTPHKLASARVYLQSHGLADRVGLAGGDPAEAVTVAADLYLLRAVLQQCGDASAEAILRNIREAMPDGARLVVIERLMPEHVADDPAAVMLDLHMMVISGGRARTRAEMEALLSRAGLEVSKVAAASSNLTLLEAAAA
jgi:hypothetical protein